MGIKHAFTNPKSDGADTTVTRPSDWNADHVVVTVSATLTGAVTIASGSWTDVLSISLSAGTWIVWATGLITCGAGGNGYIRVFDGTNTYAELTGSVPSASFQIGLHCTTPPFTLGSTTTVKLQGQTNVAGTWQVSPTAITANKATSLVAMLIG